MRLLRDIAEHHEKLDKISAQLEKNAGSSLRDAVDGIVSSIAIIDSRTAVMSAVQTAQIDSADHGIVYADLSGGLTWANRTFRRLVGKEGPELRRDGWMQTIHPSDLFLVTTGWAEAVRRQIDYLPSMPITYLDPEGQPFQMRVTARVIRDSEGKPLFY